MLFLDIPYLGWYLLRQNYQSPRNEIGGGKEIQSRLNSQFEGRINARTPPSLLRDAS